MPDSVSWTVLFFFSQLTLFKQVSYLINTSTLRYLFWILFLDLQSQRSEDFNISRTFFLLKICCEILFYSSKFALVTTDFLVPQLNADRIWTANKKLFVFKTWQPPQPLMTSVLLHQMIEGVLN